MWGDLVLFYIDNRIISITDKDLEKISNNIIEVYTQKEYKEKCLKDNYDINLLRDVNRLYFCKNDVMPNGLYGTFGIPKKGDHYNYDGFIYEITKKRILFIDDSGLVLKIIQLLSQRINWSNPSIGKFFHSFLDILIENDLVFLEGIETRVFSMEEEIISDKMTDFNERLLEIRKGISIFNRYYEQMLDVTQELIEDENENFEKEAIQLFKMFMNRIIRLHAVNVALKEHLIEVREAYHNQISANQNKIMKIFTVITAIFLPLSLIAAWYGMNFVNMPELQWRYGYLYVIILSIAIAIICVIIFRKKKYL